ncbi:MAG: trypsin-like peptidase domain-containing protein [Desulfocapsaceae bacterium]|nr:trypsin-like peptidase domain-containing protein [Desulfocapsaceae bacterium]
MPTSSRRSSSPLILIVLLILVGLWLVYKPVEQQHHDPTATPHVVAARGNLAADEQNTIDVFKNVSPAVVYITSIALRHDLFSLNAIEIPQGTGSGFIWDDQGRVVTNYHVISDANRIQVTMSDNSVWKAVLIGAAPDKDLAVLQIDAPKHLLKPIPIGESQNLLVGQKVFAIGNPFGLDQTMTSGIISALGREIKAITGRQIRGVIQTDAAINPGNSGGPLLDSAGRLIGVNTAIYSPSGAYAGIGFAVSVEDVNQVIPQLIRHGKLLRPGIGATLADTRLVKRLGLEGALILNIEKDGPAHKAGLHPTEQRGNEIILGDIVSEVAGKKVQSYDDIRTELERFQVGEEVTLTIIRDGRPMQVPLRLSALE